MTRKKKASLEERFSMKIEVQEESGCWNWMGAMARGTLPMFITRESDGSIFSISARRYAFYVSGISLEKENSEIWNQCENIYCINPAHQIENTIENRFWLLVDIKGKDECWNWRGFTDKGYGNFDGHKAHRFSYKLAYGEFKKELDVLHTCDNPSCCNPKHLFLGTHLQNMKDMVEKGRSKRGEESAKHKLTESSVREIRRKISLGQSCYSISREHGVDPKTIRNIKSQKTWYWLS